MESLICATENMRVMSYAKSESTPYSRLRMAIILRAIDDYRLISTAKCASNGTVNKKEIENFFKSDWCKLLMCDFETITPIDIVKNLGQMNQKARKAEDLTGRQFGKLKVIRKAEDGEYSSNSTQTVYLCKCECGNTAYVQTPALRSGNTRSCGCLRKANASKIVQHRWKKA